MDTGGGFGLDDAAAVLGGAAALLGLAATSRGWYRRTLGRRRDRYERLGRLGTGAQLSFFESVLGEPAAMRRTITKEDYKRLVYADDPRFDPALGDPDDPVHEIRERRDFTECFFIDRDYYVQTISDDDGTVLAFSITTRHKRFRPVLGMTAHVGRLRRSWWRVRWRERYQPVFRVQLGRTRFADLGSDEFDATPQRLKVWVGGRGFWYSEFHYLGNPGYYQTFVVTASSAAAAAPAVSPMEVTQEIGGVEWPNESAGDSPEWETLKATHHFRRSTAITTYTVIGGGLDPENYPTNFGPHGDEVRTLP